MSQLSFAETDPASVESAVIGTYESITGSTLYPGDPVRLFLEALAYTLSVQNNIINLAGMQNLLAHAQSGHLDEVALMTGSSRLGDAAARCVQRFTLAAPLDFAVHIPAGTRVTTGDSRAVFATHGNAVIPAGSLSVESLVVAQTAGTSMNGLIAGQINRLIDPLAYISKSENVTPTVFGADVENDERLRARAQLAPEAFTCAGPVGAYRSRAMAAHQDIFDAAVWSPRPGTVDIRPILKGGELPAEEILALVREKVSADDVRPLTDTVIVAAPEVVDYTLDVAWALRRQDEALSASVKTRVEAAVENYRLWQRSVPGRDINPTKLVSLMEQAGARRVLVASPEFVKLAPRQIARETSINVQFLGIEEE